MVLNSLRIAQKLTVLQVVVAIALLVTGATAYHSLSGTSAQLSAIVDKNTVQQRYAINFLGSVHDRAISLRDFVLLDDADARKDALAEISRLEDKYAKSAAPLDVLLLEAQEKDDAGIAALQAIKSVEAETAPVIEEVIRLRTSGDAEAARALLLDQASPLLTQWLGAIDNFVALKDERNNTLKAQMQSSLSLFKYAVLFGTIALALLTTVLIWNVSRSINAPLAGMLRSLQAAAHNDFTVAPPDAPEGTEIGDLATAFDKCLQNLARLEREKALEVKRTSTKEADLRARDQALEEIKAVLDQAAAGRLSVRMQLGVSDDGLDPMRNGFNEMLATVEAVLGEAEKAMSDVSNGDLMQQMSTDRSGKFGDLAREVNASIERLASLIGGAQGASVRMKTAGDTIVGNVHDISRRTESQAASLEQTAATMEEISATVKTNTESARNARELSQNTTEIAKRCGTVAEQAVETMRNIERGAHKISEITSTVDGIAFQTNLLALNAAVEAARAGDAGRGFAVVAQEVRTLAQRASEAASDISGLVAESTAQVSAGVERVEATGQSLNEIVGGIGQVAEAIAQIASASDEQANGIMEITAAVTSLDNETQRTALLVSDSTTAVSDLDRETKTLTTALSAFKVPGGLSLAAPSPIAASATPPKPSKLEEDQDRSWMEAEMSAVASGAGVAESGSLSADFGTSDNPDEKLFSQGRNIMVGASADDEDWSSF